MAQTVITYPNGIMLDVESPATAFTYDGDGNPLTATIVQNGITFIQTYTYTDGNPTNISQWVQQS
jgi:hypothetical protein